MDKAAVLAKFYRVSDRLKADQFKDHQKDGDKTLKLSHLARGILGYLHRTSNINQRMLAKEMNVSAQAISETIKKLEHQGCIVRVSGTQNNENILMLTELGDELGKKFEQRIKNHADEVFESLSEEELESFSDVLEKLL